MKAPLAETLWAGEMTFKWNIRNREVCNPPAAISRNHPMRLYHWGGARYYIRISDPLLTHAVDSSPILYIPHPATFGEQFRRRVLKAMWALTYEMHEAGLNVHPILEMREIINEKVNMDDRKLEVI